MSAYRFHKLDEAVEEEEYELESPSDERRPLADGRNETSASSHSHSHSRNRSVPMIHRTVIMDDNTNGRAGRHSVAIDSTTGLNILQRGAPEVELVELPPDPEMSVPRVTLEADDMQTGWKRRLFLLMEDPSSSGEAFIVHVVVTTLIVLSALLTTIETIPAFRSTESRVWFSMETVLVALFTIEYISRVISHSDTAKQLIKWMITPYAIIDLIATLPFYIELAFHQDTTYEFRFTILRTFRLLRVFRAFRYSSTLLLTIEVFIVAIRRSTDALVALSFFIFTSIILFSTLMYFAERGTWDDTLQTFVDPSGSPSMFDSIPSSGWFFIATITTTGYGDIVPRTWLGKLIALPMMLCGLLLIALPSLILSRNFTIVWEAFQVRRRANLELQAQGSPLPQMMDEEDQHVTEAPTFGHDRNESSNLSRRRTSDELMRSQAQLAQQVTLLAGQVKQLTQLNMELMKRFEGLQNGKEQ